MRLAVLNIVGLSRSWLGEHTPGLLKFAESNGLQSYAPAFPAVTCTVQSSILTGKSPADHGIVANGWYDRESAEVRFWKQSNHIVRGDKIWDTLRQEIPGFTCAKLFWWYNMHSSADYTITPRPLYPADGRKVFDIHTQPMGMREELKRDLGDFPFPSFWGPAAGIPSSEWIAASAKWVEEKHSPSLSLVYLPHLDYSLQKDGPEAPSISAELAKIDKVASDLIAFYEGRSVKVVVISEYGISPVSRPVHLNRLFREKGWLSIKNELGRETLDYGGCRAFAVADHQIAHVYVNDPSISEEVHELLTNTAGVEEIRTPQSGIAAERAGDFIAIAEADAWFTYYYWNDDVLAPDFARTIDIHRKPGYDPCELFIDPAIRFPKLKIAKFLLKKKAGIRGLLDVIPLDASLVKGSHGRDNVAQREQPIVIGLAENVCAPQDIHTGILNYFLPKQLNHLAYVDRPKLLGDAMARDARRKELASTHMEPLNAFVEKLRNQAGVEAFIPDFDPWDGGIHAEILFLLEAPGAKAVHSGFISRNNPDETAKNMFELTAESGIARKKSILWNIVPWYLGDGKKIKPAVASDLLTGSSSLTSFLELLPKLRVIVLVGRKAEYAEKIIRVNFPSLQIFQSPHPSPLFVNNAPGNRERILKVFTEASVFLSQSKVL